MRRVPNPPVTDGPARSVVVSGHCTHWRPHGRYPVVDRDDFDCRTNLSRYRQNAFFIDLEFSSWQSRELTLRRSMPMRRIQAILPGGLPFGGKPCIRQIRSSCGRTPMAVLCALRQSTNIDSYGYCRAGVFLRSNPMLTAPAGRVDLRVEIGTQQLRTC